MAKPATTHVLEIESGIGEPAFIPLTLGQELQPISVGKKGMWRVEGARVLDVHAFVYFDGNALFLQSADESQAALVDGYKVGKTWTELHAPCRIEVGAARLRFRSLIGDNANAQTVAQAAPPVKAPPGGPGGGPGPHASAPPPPRTAPAPATGRPPGPAPAEPLSFPKPERPFAPGALAAHADDESTRIAPAIAPPPGMSGAIQAVNTAAPRPAAGRPVEEDLSTRPEAARAAKAPTGQVQAVGTGPYPAGPTPLGMPPGMVGQPGQGMHPGGMPYGPQGSTPPGMQPGMQPMQPMPSGSMPPGMPPPGGYGYPQAPSGAYGPPGYPQQQGPSGAYGPMPSPSGQMPAGGPSMAPGGYGSMTPQPGAPKQGEGLQSFSEVMKDPAQRKKLLAVGVILLGGVYLLLLDDDPPPPKKPVATLDAGVHAEGGAVAAGTGTGGVVPVASPCPPGFQPYGEIKAGAPITCVPVATPPVDTVGGAGGGGGVIPSSNDAGATQLAAGGSGGGAVDAGAHDAAKPKITTTTQKTLERTAVDYVALGEYQKAIGIYEQLSRQFPDNKVYSEALRILRQKLDAGSAQ